MPRDYLADSERRLADLYALLGAGMEDMKPVDGNADVYSSVVIVRDDVRMAMDGLKEIERGRLTEQTPSPELPRNAERAWTSRA